MLECSHKIVSIHCPKTIKKLMKKRGKTNKEEKTNHYLCQLKYNAQYWMGDCG